MKPFQISLRSTTPLCALLFISICPVRIKCINSGEVTILAGAGFIFLLLFITAVAYALYWLISSALMKWAQNRYGSHSDVESHQESAIVRRSLPSGGTDMAPANVDTVIDVRTNNGSEVVMTHSRSGSRNSAYSGETPLPADYSEREGLEKIGEGEYTPRGGSSTQRTMTRVVQPGSPLAERSYVTGGRSVVLHEVPSSPIVGANDPRRYSNASYESYSSYAHVDGTQRV